ncbi:tRNA(Ile)-lysidine synthase [Lecanosticta acicola]|uniref:tRNA(Ile)-lysidine synthetase n=1 Tax=Lecanosticta acicola TaxID=111012 RepID=A0AAI8YVQ3_9PEZI|nr:tRNA(Ile)-lysidine synthase [Lecanosticta acicola]
MALATICSSTSNQHDFMGFIVDHKLRRGSGEEAKKAASELERLNIRAQILELDWGAYGDLKTLTNLETIARRLRYQALGRACYRQGIQQLLVGHHADDQAETVLSRICANYLGTGLQGIQIVANIPECRGIYGVDHSGMPRTYVDPKGGTEIVIEDGGVKILRPLLNFSKNQLVRVCEEANTTWFDDKTNSDTSLTVRNTLRLLLKQNLLPRALKQDSLCQLATRMVQRNERVRQRAAQLLEDTSINMLWRSGGVECSLNSLHRYRDESESVKAVILRKLLCLVRSDKDISLKDLDHAVEFVFPENQKAYAIRAGITISGVYMQIKSAGALEDSESPKLVLEMLRQPRPRSEQTELDLGAREHYNEEDGLFWTQWHLYDGQYWIRAASIEESSKAKRYRVLVRDLSDKPAGIMNSDDWHDIKRTVALPDYIRRQLPTILLDQNGQHKLLALPSVDYRKRKPGPTVRNYTWQIRYQHVRLP